MLTKFFLAACPPQDVSRCIHGFICSDYSYGGCLACHCLTNTCGIDTNIDNLLYDYFNEFSRVC